MKIIVKSDRYDLSVIATATIASLGEREIVQRRFNRSRKIPIFSRDQSFSRDARNTSAGILTARGIAVSSRAKSRNASRVLILAGAAATKRIKRSDAHNNSARGRKARHQAISELGKPTHEGQDVNITLLHYTPGLRYAGCTFIELHQAVCTMVVDRHGGNRVCNHGMDDQTSPFKRGCCHGDPGMDDTRTRGRCIVKVHLPRW